jgi:hypothetical protein
MRNLFQPILTIVVLSFITLNLSTISAQTTWNLQFTNDEIEIRNSEPTVCNFSEGTVQAEYIFLQIRNLLSRPVKVSFRVDVYYVGIGCGTCANDEYQYTFNIPSGGTISADCNFTTTGQSKLAIFKKFITKTNHREFEKFEITGIAIE